MASTAWLRAMPAVFVLIWSTGFVVARLGMPHAPPFGFLAWRFALSVLLFVAWVRLARAAWPQGRRQYALLAVTGVLMHAGYLGGVWAAIKLGLGAATAALIVGLQPLLTALWTLWALRASGRGEGQVQGIGALQWLGLLLGLAGLALVVGERLGAGQATLLNVALAAGALVSITAGTLFQKRWVAPCDVRSAACVQLAAAFLVTLPLAWFETEALHWVLPLQFAMAWSVLVLTLGGSSLLYLLIQRGAATRVTSLMYLVPPCTALLAWALFDEAITRWMVGGMVLSAIGVALVLRAPAEGAGVSSGQAR
jgi:drug/metabolite transporter (DMT)-like permease